MIILKSTTEILELVTSSTADIDYSISYVDITTTTFLPSSSEGKVVSAITTPILSAPSASTQRQVKLITITNRHASTSNNILVKKDIAGTEYYLTPTITLLAGEVLQYVDSQGWVYYSSAGEVKSTQSLRASGADSQVQFNGSGALTGDAGLTYNSTNDILGLSTAAASIQLGSAGITANPILPGASTLSIFGRTVANRMMIAQVGPSGLDTVTQPFLARNKIAFWNPPGNATTAPGVFGIAALTAQGTATSRTVAVTSMATRMKRLGYPSAATAGSFAGARLAAAQFSCGSGVANDGSGFFLIERWVESDPAVVSGRRAFHGMTSSTGAMSNVEVDTLTNRIGICQLSTDATQWYWYGAGSVAQSAVAVGAGIGAPGGNSTTAWELAIFAPNNIASTYYVQLLNLTTGATASRTFSGAVAVVPQSNTLLAWNAWATNNATALAVGIDLCSLYIETDY